MGRSEFDYLPPRPAWNAGRKVGAKRPLKPRQIWAIRFHLDREHRLRDRALFDLAIDSKLRGCDLVKIKIGDLVTGGEMRTRAMVIQQKTGRPVQFEIMSDARGSRSDEHTSALQSLMRISYAVFRLKKQNYITRDSLLI